MQFFKNILQNEELRMQLACIAISGAALLASMLDIRPYFMRCAHCLGSAERACNGV